ncbi:MAG: hypothetical protein MJ014_04790 [Methanocorpusculum sp.]|nr:hypothetical protein [Methanocorpusculum sp.]
MPKNWTSTGDQAGAWITYDVPFMIPITLGHLLALAGLSLSDAILPHLM